MRPRTLPAVYLIADLCLKLVLSLSERRIASHSLLLIELAGACGRAPDKVALIAADQTDQTALNFNLTFAEHAGRVGRVRGL